MKTEHADEILRQVGLVDGDDLVCPECKARKQQLSNHLRYKHQIEPNDLRIELGIPLSVGLVSPSLRAHESKANKEGVDGPNWTPIDGSKGNRKGKPPNGWHISAGVRPVEGKVSVTCSWCSKTLQRWPSQAEKPTGIHGCTRKHRSLALAAAGLMSHGTPEKCSGCGRFLGQGHDCPGAS